MARIQMQHSLVTDIQSADAVLSAQKQRMMIGQALELGNEYVILFPLRSGSIVVAGLPSRSASFGPKSFARCKLQLGVDFEMDPETGKLKDISELKAWGRLSNLLYKAAQAKETADKLEEERRRCETAGTEFNEVSANQIIENVNILYNGAPAEEDKEAVYPKRKRILDSITVQMFTEAVLLPLDKDTLKPLWGKAVGVEIALTPGRIKQLKEILKTPAYSEVADPDGFLEVKFSYKGDKKNIAGQNKYVGVELDHRKVDLTKDEDGNYVGPIKESQHVLNGTAHDPESIYNRSGTVSMAKPITEITAKLRQYIASNVTLFEYVDMTDESFRVSARDFYAANIFNPNTKQYRELEEIVIELNEEEGIEPEDTNVSDAIGKLANASSVADVAGLSEEEIKDAMDDEDIVDI